MPRSTKLSSYDMSYYQAVEAASKMQELRLPFSTEKRAKSERLSYYAFKKALEIHVEGSIQPKSRNAEIAWQFVRDLEFVVEGNELILRKSGAQNNSLVQKALEQAKAQGFISTFGLPQLPEVDRPPAEPPAELPPQQHIGPKEKDPMESALEKLGFFAGVSKREESK